MQILKNQNINFNGNVVVTARISKKAKKAQQFLADVLDKKCNGKNFRELISEMPFDAYISCKNPTKKAINPCLTVFLEKKETKESIGLYSITHLKYNKSNEIERMHNIISNFEKVCEDNKNKKPLNKKESNCYIAEKILSGLFNKK